MSNVYQRRVAEIAKDNILKNEDSVPSAYPLGILYFSQIPDFFLVSKLEFGNEKYPLEEVKV